MRPDKSKNLITIFLYVLLLFALGIILYLLLLRYQQGLLDEALTNTDQPALTTRDGGAIGDIELDSGVIETYTVVNSGTGSFSYEVPEGWLVEENLDAGFTVIRTPENINVATIRIATKIPGMIETPFAEYASTAAMEEIQDYQKLESIAEVKNDLGQIGYKTTWQIRFLGGEQFISNPLTYFEHPLDQSKSIQIQLENPEFAAIYDHIIQTFTIN